jgi:hypothetical protein
MKWNEKKIILQYFCTTPHTPRHTTFFFSNSNATTANGRQRLHNGGNTKLIDKKQQPYRPT